MEIRPVFDLHRNARALALGVIYAGCLGLAFWLAFELRFDFAVPETFVDDRRELLFPVVVLQLGALVAARQFGTLLTYFSLPDLLRVSYAMFGAAVVFMAWRAISPNLLGDSTLIPRGVILSNLVLAMMFLSALRISLRVYRERTNQRAATITPASMRRRIAIVGAGDVGASLAREFASKRGQQFVPVVFLDDDASKWGRIIHGIPVAGRPESALEIAARIPFSHVVLAMPGASVQRNRDVIRHLTQGGFTVEIVPSMEDLVSGKVTVSRIRPVAVEDLLGRPPVKLDDGAIDKLVTGRVIMVTGAGGSIGAELCRQIVARNPKRLVMVEQSEGALFNVEQELIGLGAGAVIKAAVGDVVDADRMCQVLELFRPEVIFHAAAHKHVYLMERQPGEAVKNNAMGTRQLAGLAEAAGVGYFVFISTDKAINPTSVMGATKRLAELALQDLQRRGSTTKFLAVRFGNVLGSSGSVVPIFKRQIEAGGPVTVTHPDVTRYFMTIPEAVGLVLQASVLARGGEIFVLDMGKPVKIVDLARQMIELSGYKPDIDIEIKFSGLKPGEKLYEELQHQSEEHTATEHPSIMRFSPKQAAPDELHWDDLKACLHRTSNSDIKRALAALVPEYTPFID